MTQPILRAVGPGVTYYSANSTIAKPAGVVAGDLMLAFLEADGNIGVADWSTLIPAGWTILYQELNGGVSLWWPMVAYKVAGGAEPASYGFSFNTQAGRGVIAAWSGVSTTTPINVSAAQNNSTSAATTACPSVTTTSGDCRLVTAYFRRTASGFSFIEPAGMVARFNNDGGAAANSSFGFAELGLPSTAGATGTKTATSPTADISYGVSIALTPAVAPVTPSDLSGNITLDNAVAAGAFSSIASSLSGGVTLDDSVAAGAFGVAPGVVTITNIKNSNGSLLAGVTLPNVVVIRRSDRVALLALTAQVINGSGALVIPSTALIPGTACQVAAFENDGSLGGCWPATVV